MWCQLAVPQDQLRQKKDVSILCGVTIALRMPPPQHGYHSAYFVSGALAVLAQLRHAASNSAAVMPYAAVMAGMLLPSLATL